MDEAQLLDEVHAIEAMDLEQLRELWARRYGAPIPALRSVPILRMLLAWRVQAEALGGIDGPTRRALARKGRLAAEGLDLGIGARLTRQWQGREVEVVVEAQGFRWEGTSYKSLSAAATAIAGSRWNGPRFFGLRENAA
jgi:Protein of unknown function (DUF2924)